MRFNILLFVSIGLALRIPRCEMTTTTSIDESTSSPLPSSTTILRAGNVDSAKQVSFSNTKSPVTVTYTTVSLPPSPIEKSVCTPHSICADYRNACGQRYGGCFDENYCDGNTSPFPVPTCDTPPSRVKRAVVAGPIITAA